jgi:hypothetical protein
MGMSTEGVLLYGYELGGDDLDWKIKGVGEYEDPVRPWLDPDDPDFCEDARKHLLAEIAGFREEDYTRPPYDVYREAKHAAEAKVGVDLGWHGHLEYSGYVIYTKRIEIHQSQTEVLDLLDLTAQVQAQNWDLKLSRALRILDIEPMRDRPHWLLTATTG